MILRNKKTGEIEETVPERIYIYFKGSAVDECFYYSYNSLAELNEEWEDETKK